MAATPTGCRLGPGLTLLLVALLFITGCASCPVPESWIRTQTAALRDRLQQLDRAVDAREAEQLAETAVEQSAALACEYQAIRPAWLNNFLVNGGRHRRGLCYQWTNDLFPRLHALQLRSLELHLAVARMDTPHEHNAIVVTARRQPFAAGVVLDAWRHSGRLWFGNVVNDKYPWEPLPRDRVASELDALVPR